MVYDNIYTRLAILGICFFALLKLQSLSVEHLDNVPLDTQSPTGLAAPLQQAAEKPVSSTPTQAAGWADAMGDAIDANGDDSIFTGPGADLEAIFTSGNQNELRPEDLVPAPETSDPLFDDAQVSKEMESNFINNPWSYGVETAVAKRAPINDLRGIRAIEQVKVSPWGNPTRIGADIANRTIGDVS